MMYLAGGIAALAAIAAIAAICRRGQICLAMQIVAMLIAVVMVIAEGAAFARPLTLESIPMNSLLAQANHQEAVARYAGQAAITSHAVMPMIRPNTQLALNPHEAVQRWLASPPGTLFFWESKYCGAGVATEGEDELITSLRQGGVMIASLTSEGIFAIYFCFCPGWVDAWYRKASSCHGLGMILATWLK
jgi:hypothetical protein